jgi:hypothetical protein
MVIEQKFVAGQEPDPTEYLFISMEMKMKDQSKAYDAKTACWVPDPAEGFVQGEIKKQDGDNITVWNGNEVRHMKYQPKRTFFSMYENVNLHVFFMRFNS